MSQYDNIVKPGTEVKFKRQFATNYNGIIKAVWIGESGVQYQVAYFNQGVMQEPYVTRDMFEVVDQRPISTGFQISSPK